MQSLRLRPYRPFLAWVVPCAALALAVHRVFWAVAAVGVMVVWGLWLVDVRARRSAIAQTQHSLIE
jgi:hypothetical protein